jgi:hypothetical protein
MYAALSDRTSPMKTNFTVPFRFLKQKAYKNTRSEQKILLLGMGAVVFDYKLMMHPENSFLLETLRLIGTQ